VDASFQLNPGEEVGLVGPNGSGRTTLFRMVVGEETPDEGAVSIPKKLTIGYFRLDGFRCLTSVHGNSARNGLLRADLFHQGVIIPEEVFLRHCSLVIPMSERRHR
jgi:ABC-type polysaccharide/polyol phosphate transport system ATPase subunit